MKKSDRSKRVIVFLSIAMAIFFWFFAMEDINPSRSKEFTNIPINYYGLREGLTLTEEGRQTVNVSVRGRRNDLKSINRNDFSVDVDLSKYGAGEHDIRLYGTNRTGVSNLKVVYSPSRTNIKIEKLLNKTFDIKIEFQGKVPEGFDTERIALSNNTCSVEGAESAVKSIEKMVVYIDAASMEGNASMTGNIIAVNGEGEEVQGLEKSIETVEVMIPFEKSHPVKIEPSIIGEPAEGYELESYTVKPEMINLVKVSDEAEDISTVQTEDFDITDLESSTEKNVKIIIPKGYTYSGSGTATVKISIKEKKEIEENSEEKEEKQTKSLSTVFTQANITGMPAGFEIAEPVNQTVEVVVEGSGEAVNGADASQISLSGDLSGANQSGQVMIPISVSIDSGSLKIKSVKPQSIAVNLVKTEEPENPEELKTE